MRRSIPSRRRISTAIVRRVPLTLPIPSATTTTTTTSSSSSLRMRRMRRIRRWRRLLVGVCRLSRIPVAAAVRGRMLRRVRRMRGMRGRRRPAIAACIPGRAGPGMRGTAGGRVIAGSLSVDGRGRRLRRWRRPAVTARVAGRAGPGMMGTAGGRVIAGRFSVEGGRRLGMGMRTGRVGRARGGGLVVSPRVGVARLDVRPQRVGRLAVAEAAVVAAAAGQGAVPDAAGEDVVLVVADRLGREQLAEAVAVRRLLRPLAHRLEHVAVDLDALVACRRVVERAQHVVDDLVGGDARVLPGVDDAACARGGKRKLSAGRDG